MSHSRRLSGTIVAGADLGGTWTRVAVTDGVRIWRARGRAGSLLQFATLLHKTVQGAGARLPCEALVVAARGVWTTRERAGACAQLGRLARRVRVLSDAEAAWRAALGAGPGVLVLAGTGSIALGRDARGRWARAGGLGPLLDDEGSAFWLGREWLRANDDEVRARRLARRADAVARIAALAPRVLADARAGDRRAAGIVRAGQVALARHARDVVKALRLPPPVTIGWAGALMDDARYRRGVARALAGDGVRARWRPPRGEPVDAALALARAALGPARADAVVRRRRVAGERRTRRAAL